MVFPLYDDNPFKRATLPYVTWGLIGTNAFVFMVMLGSSGEQQTSILAQFAVIPLQVTDAFSHGFRPEAGLVTGMFLHAGWEHIIGNMIYLWVFGDDIEDALGSFRFLAFYLLAGVAGAVAFVLLNPQSMTPLIGASGAVSGVLAAYLMLRPCAKVSIFVLRVVVRVRAFWVIGGWGLLQIFGLFNKTESDVAYLAHAGGFAAGVLLFLALRPAGTPLFECRQAEATAP